MEHLMLSSTLQRELRAMRLLLAGSYPPTCQPVPLKAPWCTVGLLSCASLFPQGTSHCVSLPVVRATCLAAVSPLTNPELCARLLDKPARELPLAS